jgi:dihydrofolate reductase
MSSGGPGSLLRMGRIMVMQQVSVDGYTEGPGADIGWHLVDEELHTHLNEVLGMLGAQVMGRVTYELMEAFWPTADDDPEVAGPVREYAGIYRRTPKVVYSRTLEHVGPGAELVRDVDTEQVHALQQRFDGDIGVGGARLASAFRRLDLVDSWRVYVHPVVLGAGTPLFAPADGRLRLDLVETRRFGNGVVLLHYARP